MAVRLNRLDSVSDLDRMRPACRGRGYSEHQPIVQ